MAVPNPHAEEYEVREVKDLKDPIRIWLRVKEKSAAGDNPVEDMYLRKYSSGSTRTGIEDLQDGTARVRLTTKDFSHADTEIIVGSTVSYVSNKHGDVETIEQFTWG